MYNQEFFDIDKFESRQICITTKNARAKELRLQGYHVVSSVLKNQQRGYSGWNTTKDTTCRDVFMLTIHKA